jgi:hypothetical protein
MAKDTVTVPLTFTRPVHSRLSELKDKMNLTWEEFFLKPYENMEETCDGTHA